MNKKFWKF